MVIEYHKKHKNLLPNAAKQLAANARFMSFVIAKHAFWGADYDSSVSAFKAFDFVFIFINSATGSRDAFYLVYNSVTLRWISILYNSKISHLHELSSAG